MDFTQQLAALGSGVTFATSPAPSVSVTVSGGGNDPNPAEILDGSPIVNGNVVGQWLKNGIAGVTYIITFAASASDGSVFDRQRAMVVIAQY